MDEPYFVEVDTNGCSKCGHDRTWTVIGPDGVAHHTSYSDIDDAQSLAEALNAAFAAGLHEKQRQDRKAREAISAVIIPPPCDGQLGSERHVAESGLCEGCPPAGYPTDDTRCTPCPRRSATQDREGEHG